MDLVCIVGGLLENVLHELSAGSKKPLTAFTYQLSVPSPALQGITPAWGSSLSLFSSLPLLGSPLFLFSKYTFCGKLVLNSFVVVNTVA